MILDFEMLGGSSLSDNIDGDERISCVPAVRDMQQMYDMWLTLAAQNRQEDGAVFTQPNPEEKFIVMPTDYAELMVG